MCVKPLSVFAQHRGLAPLDLSDDDQRILNVFDGFFVIHNYTVPFP
jgi:hypothetical protein